MARNSIVVAFAFFAIIGMSSAMDVATLSNLAQSWSSSQSNDNTLPPVADLAASLAAAPSSHALPPAVGDYVDKVDAPVPSPSQAHKLKGILSAAAPVAGQDVPMDKVKGILSAAAPAGGQDVFPDTIKGIFSAAAPAGGQDLSALSGFLSAATGGQTPPPTPPAQQAPVSSGATFGLSVFASVAATALATSFFF